MTDTADPAVPRPTRRTLLRAGAVGLGAAAVTGFAGAPALARGGDRPLLTHGIQLGDPRTDGAVVWTRADRAARMLVEVSSRPDFKRSRTIRGPELTPATDGTGKVRITGLRPGQEVYLRVRAESDRVASEAAEGRFRTTGRGEDPVRFVWSGDVAGQGWGINPEFGGMRIFAAMAERDPDFFLHSGDSVYADGPLAESVTLPDGRVWRNIVTEEKSKVAETLAEFRGQYAYNLTDDVLRAFSAHVPQIVQWDDHEVTNNWYPGETLPEGPYTERDVDVLTRRAQRAFHEWQPILPKETVDGKIYRRIPCGPDLDVFVIDMRTYRDANSAGTAPYERILGATQARWLVEGIAKSKATWKVVASDMPIGVIVPDGSAIEAVANGRPGVPAGREAEIQWVLHSLHRRGVTDVVWLTADVHYTAAHHYSPDRASSQEFQPFWEFVSGPLHAGAFGPNQLDPTFGPEAVFVNAPPRANTSPLEGFQHFGEVEIDPESKRFTVDLRDIDGRSLWRTSLTPTGR
ncbi:alkaline phosphatase D family protein [Marinitenerispora sediminis]|uniref:Alkaline phosphatase n=1 Tax=Marinitenerispora sediminis TaxID=1931232 RepID=A0A368TB81_9ACTN|nr:alkaline phosphatase D family protein [Marinitenerispora sediminis]RCV54399.1 alkaline phosphatase [Marinitenerispora sediminis]RCV61128.1 alkaline phosphatase [Marinitenerispora sediminis]RCV62404.1 alkaline phosphatase [Marinitenerispora sediminis]